MTGATTGGFPHQYEPCGELEPLPMGDNGHRGDYGEQFIRALAAAANLDAARRERDRVGIDWNLGYPGRSGTRRFPAIDVQVKSWSTPNDDPDTLRYPLRIKNYNWLAGREWQLPRFLFLVVTPVDPACWADATHDRLQLRHAAYWACLHHLEPLDRPDKSSCVVEVPRANLLTVEALHGLFTEDFREMLVAS
ncbi:DUF4365 domain-containing protein [Streptomyces hygroscopicus]|uniref:DUF4365 domain-containing protein n=2 Tax=Streptomyces hygroscopicus TaxID=1912 RepID=UPI0009A06DA2